MDVYNDKNIFSSPVICNAYMPLCSSANHRRWCGQDCDLSEGAGWEDPANGRDLQQWL